MGREVVVAVSHGRLDFGPWEQVFYGEFDGRRRRRVLVEIIGESCALRFVIPVLAALKIEDAASAFRTGRC
jgi:hypothetical protein